MAAVLIFQRLTEELQWVPYAVLAGKGSRHTVFADDASVSTTIHLLRSVIFSVPGLVATPVKFCRSSHRRLGSSGPRCSNTRAPRPPRCSHLGCGVLRPQATKGSGTKWLPSLRSALVELDVHRTSQLLSPARRVANAARCRRSVLRCLLTRPAPFDDMLFM